MKKWRFLAVCTAIVASIALNTACGKGGTDTGTSP
jgi:hypothetical protein